MDRRASAHGGEDLAGRSVLVTGGARRVGEAISRHLSRLGARVLVHYHRSGALAERLVSELEGGGRALAADLSRASGPAELVDALFSLGENPDSVVHSAASFLRRPALETTAEEWDRVFALNLRSLFLLAQAFVRHRRRADGDRGGHIVVISDAAALDIWPNYLAHSVAKAAGLALVKGLARELAPTFQVNAVIPGPVLPPEEMSPRQVREVQRRTLLQRLGEPRDVAEAVAFLLRSRYTTGSTVEVTGGSQLWRGR